MREMNLEEKIELLEKKVAELEKLTQPQTLKEIINKTISQNYLESIELEKKRYAHLLKDSNQ